MCTGGLWSRHTAYTGTYNTQLAIAVGLSIAPFCKNMGIGCIVTVECIDAITTKINLLHYALSKALTFKPHTLVTDKI